MLTKVLLADDHGLVREGLRRLLETREGLRVVGEAANGQEAVALAREYKPDVVFMDISMPVLDGIEATRRICRQVRSPRVIMLSMYASNDYVQQALDAGAYGYVLKSSVGADVIVAIQEVLAGHRFFSPKIAKSMAADAAIAGIPSLGGVPELPLPVGAI